MAIVVIRSIILEAELVALDSTSDLQLDTNTATMVSRCVLADVQRMLVTRSFKYRPLPV